MIMASGILILLVGLALFSCSPDLKNMGRTNMWERLGGMCIFAGALAMAASLLIAAIAQVMP